MRTITGLEQLIADSSLQKKCGSNIAYLCHSASITQDYKSGAQEMKKIFGTKLKQFFGPQHGFKTDVQDNMIETDHNIHEYFKIPVYSLYAETRSPTEKMLEGLDTIIVDLQDVGTRIYTYIYTLTLLMKACEKKDIKILILDRPNPIDGITIEGNILEEKFTSFVGLHPFPVRHAMTMGEVAMFAQKFLAHDANIEIVKMKNWKREFYYEQTGLSWGIPSPNLPTIEGAVTFPGTVLFEGVNISEGRGTTLSLQIIGHPEIEPFSFADHLNEKAKSHLQGVYFRPHYFHPMFSKHAGHGCGGVQIHVTDRRLFKPWRVGQFLLRECRQILGDKFQWTSPPYEYEYEKHPIDMINGTDKLRLWVENNGPFEQLDKLENNGHEQFLSQREEILLY